MSKQPVELAAFIGLDWADEQHAVCLQEAGATRREALKLDQTPEALQAWIQQLRARFGGRPVAIAVEQARGALIYALMHVDFLQLYPVNPQTLAKLRQAFYPSGAKDDPGDAELLLEVLLKHRDHLRVWVPDNVLTRSIQLLTEGAYRPRVCLPPTMAVLAAAPRRHDEFGAQVLSQAGISRRRQAEAVDSKYPARSTVD